MHVTAAAWGYAPLREHIIEMVDAGKVSAVQLDIKDEGGIVGYDTDIDLAHEIGAVRQEYVLEDAIELAEGQGHADHRSHRRLPRRPARPVGRRERPHGLRHPGHPRASLLSKYGGFTNVANADVRQYNIDLAMEAVDRGVDEILWDYVRRPEGDIAGMVFPGHAAGRARRRPLREAGGERRRRVVPGRGRRARSARSASTRAPPCSASPPATPTPSASRCRPSPATSTTSRRCSTRRTGCAGEYRVDHPNAQPYDIVHKSLADFQTKAAGSGVAFNLWVQDFSIGIPYGPAEVRAQIDAARDLGVDSWLLWNATVRYTPEAITPDIVDLPGEQ